MSGIYSSPGDTPQPFRERYTSESSSDTECDLQFKPVVQLPEVEVSTNEENEIVLLKMRAKLYRFDTNSEPSEWKDRGTGEMKLLKHKENHSVRIVMRRDKTYKVCANHFITPWMTLKPCFSSDKAFLYTVAADFADEQPKSECLAIKFASTDNANVFKTKFEEAKEILSKECSLYNGQCDKENEDDNDNVPDSDNENDENEKVVEATTQKLSELSVDKEKEIETKKDVETKKETETNKEIETTQ